MIMQKNQTYRLKFIYLALLVLALLLSGCGRKEEPQGTPVVLSYISTQKNKIVEAKTYLTGKNASEQLNEVLTLLATPSSKLEYYAPLSQEVSVLSKSLVNGSLTMNFSEEYKQLDTVTEILTRASLVKSLTQIEGINKVTFYIKGEPLKDSLDKKVGAMTADMFIDNAGEEISTYDKVTVRLYFANKDGDELVAVDRTKAYNTNISLDKFIVEELIKGPETTTKGVYPTINGNTKIITTVVKDNTCYVDFDSAFLTKTYEVDAEVAIYSIVNSLCELTGVDRVQISVNGESDVMFQEVISLKEAFTSNADYNQSKNK